MPDDVPRDMPHMCREFPGRRTFIPSNPRTGARCSLYAASERRPTSGGVPLATTRRRAAEFTARRPRGRSGRGRLTVLRRGPGSGHGAGGGAAQAGTRRGNSGPLTAARGPAGAAGHPQPRGRRGRESGRRGGPQPGPRPAGPGVRKRQGWKLPATRSLRISGAEEKKFRSREARTGTGNQDRSGPASKTGGGCRRNLDGAGFRQQDRERCRGIRTGAVPASEAGGGFGGIRTEAGRCREIRTAPVPASRNRRRVPADKNRAGSGGQETGPASVAAGPGQVKQSGGPQESHGALRERKLMRREAPAGPRW